MCLIFSVWFLNSDMALSGKVSTELEIQATAAKFFNLFVERLHHFQNILDTIHETKLHEGDDWHDTRSVKHWTYTIDGKVTTCKEKIEVVDVEKKLITFKLFDGDVGKQYKVLKFHLQVNDKDGGGSVVKWTYEYEKVNEDVAAPYSYLEFGAKATKDIDAHLLQA
ncbi:hypothetical protein VNO77_42423 [Canavalia gladiata]|uniref:Bet v I/Major latex protein domain-containing protein n=1 Tax=Canavalia gladiata TaxID=3824 RepID=A0AAN9JSS5_CANGL